jgi:hypothetical protein
MTRSLRGVLLALALSGLFVSHAGGKTITAASCSANDVATALGSVSADGTTVVIPACPTGVAWGAQKAFTSGNASVDANGQLTYKQIYSTIIQGQGNTSGSTDTLGNPLCWSSGSFQTCYNDQTVLIYNNAAGTSLWTINTAQGKYLRISGITTKQGSSGVTNTNGVWNIGGKMQASNCTWTSPSVTGPCLRIDHNHFYELGTSSGGSVMMETFGWMYGVIDHNVWDLYWGDTNGTRFSMGGYANDTSNNGNGSWNDVENFGSGNFVFMENNTFNWMYASSGSSKYGVANDCNQGGRFVFRYNTINGYIFIQTHPQEGDYRGCRAFEVYGNIANAYNDSAGSGVGPFSNFFGPRMGTGMVWGNTVTAYSSIFYTYVDRDGGNGHKFSLVPNGWGYCGNNSTTQSLGQTGDSPWDQNSNTSTGYACADQVGRGKGDLISGLFPNKVNTNQRNTQAWMRNAVSPAYVWAQNWTAPSGGNYLAYGDSLTSSLVVNNQDIYLELPNFNNSATFNGTTGIGSGTLTPMTGGAYPNAPKCTPAPIPGTTYNTNGVPGVGYWDTTTNTLYVCSAQNSWTSYYTPYTYPHPLTVGVNLTPPLPPTKLVATPK